MLIIGPALNISCKVNYFAISSVFKESLYFVTFERVIIDYAFSIAAIFLVVGLVGTLAGLGFPLAETQGWLWASLLQDMSCLLKLTPKV